MQCSWMNPFLPYKQNSSTLWKCAQVSQVLGQSSSNWSMSLSRLSLSSRACHCCTKYGGRKIRWHDVNTGMYIVCVDYILAWPWYLCVDIFLRYVQVKGGREGAVRFQSKVQVFKRATSLGGTESLLEHRRSVEGPLSTTPDNLIRISVGLEAYEVSIYRYKWRMTRHIYTRMAHPRYIALPPTHRT